MRSESNNRTSQPGTTTTALPAPLEQLRASVKGTVITADDPAYERARTVFYGGFDRRPIAVVHVADAADVAAVVNCARAAGLELAVRGGGHSMAGFGVSNGGLVIDLSPMKGLEIDSEQQTLWAEAGLTAGEVTKGAAEHGLAVGFGDTGSVGIGGITLGGGVGYLVRKYGLTIDSLLAAEIVTADGQRLTTDAEHHPDLFWALRGGGGNFGVVTRFKYQLQPVDQIVGGMLILPATAEVIHRFVLEAEAAPDELSAIANVMTAPPMPFLPPEVHGKLIIMGLMAYAGDVNEGESVMARFRALAPPLADMVRPMRYVDSYPPDEEDYHPLAAGRNLFVDKFDECSAQLIVDRLQSSTAFMAVTQIRVLGGAMARVPNDATAFAHRQRRLMLNVAALYNNPAEAELHEAWTEDFMAALRGDETGVYSNFLGNEGADRLREAYPPATYARLAQIKQRYDPSNLFRLNHNIQPASAE